MNPINDDVETVVETFFDQWRSDTDEVAVTAQPPQTYRSASVADLPEQEPLPPAEGTPDADLKGPSRATGPAYVDRLQGNETNEEVATVPPPFGQFSVILIDLPDDERSLIIEGVRDAVAKGVFKAAGLDSTFRATYRDDTGKRIRKTVQDLAISFSPEFSTWLEAQRRASRHQAMVRSGRVQTTMQRLLSGEDDFEQLADLTKRTFAQQQHPKKKK